MKTHSRFAVAGALALALAAAPAVAQDSMYSDWDADQSGGLDRDEFATGLNSLKIYDAWDRDAGAQMSRDDFEARYGEAEWRDDDTFDEWDADRDAALTRQEFHSGVHGAYDADEDDLLDEQEYGMFEEDVDEQGWFD